jgi:hypothetical protein
MMRPIALLLSLAEEAGENEKVRSPPAPGS